MPIPVVDIFAGPGGLGEGFSSFIPKGRKEPAFRIRVSAEKEQNAARTLRLRAFFRQFPKGEAPESYYEYVRGHRDTPWTDATRAQWRAACEEALQLELGIPDHDAVLNERVAQVAAGNQPWVLIGGPPCQAYSLVGRARNRGIRGYKPEKDDRHFLYRHYLELIRRYHPAAFVMENVKGILSSRVEGSLIFPQILRDLEVPGGRSGPRYRIVPIVACEDDESDYSRFILRAEELGVPQARHRVILLGLNEDLGQIRVKGLHRSDPSTFVCNVLKHLPHLRSQVTRRSVRDWHEFATRLLEKTANHAANNDPNVAEELRRAASHAPLRDPGTGSRWQPWKGDKDKLPEHLKSWLHDPRLGGILNHETRGHMEADLKRYAYAAAFAAIHEGRSPTGPEEFPKALHPSHRSWWNRTFVDRFKAQAWKRPSSTITSHLSKDGHYFIHPAVDQIRSITVREAARLQTFPDNYFFEGARNSQFLQVGNAVPPWMAYQIAGVVYSALSSS